MRETFEDEIFYRVRDIFSGHLYGPTSEEEANKFVARRPNATGARYVVEKLASSAWVPAGDPVTYVTVAEGRINELLRHEQAFRQAGLQISIEEESEAKRS